MYKKTIMKYIKIVIATITIVFIACGNKTREAEPVIFDNQPVVEQSEPDTVSVSVQEEADKMDDGKGKMNDVKAPVSSSSSSSSRSHKSSGKAERVCLLYLIPLLPQVPHYLKRNGFVYQLYGLTDDEMAQMKTSV